MVACEGLDACQTDFHKQVVEDKAMAVTLRIITRTSEQTVWTKTRTLATSEFVESKKS